MKYILEALDFAMMMEKEGQFFFSEWSRRVKNPTTQTIFTELAKWEQEHWQYLADQRNSLEKTGKIIPGPATTAAAERKALETFHQRAAGEAGPTEVNSCMGDLTALRLSITIEHDLHEFYGNAAKKATDPDLKDMFDMLSKWEQNHQEILENQYNALKQDFWAEMGFEPF